MEPIELIITLDDEGVVAGTARVKESIGEIPGLVDQYGRAFERGGKEAEDSLNRTRISSEKGGFALKGFKFATHEAMAELGIGGGMVRAFSHEALDLAGGLGTAAMAMGGMMTAALVAYAVVEHFTEAKKKEREELGKVTAALWDEIAARDKGALKTRQTTDAENRLYAAKRESLEFDLKKQIEAETEALVKEEKAVGKAGMTFGQYLKLFFGGGDTFTEALKLERDAHTKASNSANEHRASLELLVAKLRALKTVSANLALSDAEFEQAAFEDELAARENARLQKTAKTQAAFQALLDQQAAEAGSAAAWQKNAKKSTDELIDSLYEAATGWDYLAEKTQGASITIEHNQALLARATQTR